MTGLLTYPLCIVALLVQWLWPRYLFMSVAGKGVSPYTGVTMVLLAAMLAAFAVHPLLRRRAVAGATRSWALWLCFALWWGWRLLSDVVAGERPDALSSTLLDLLYLGSWMVSAAILFADDRLVRRLPYLVGIAVMIATAAGLAEWQTGTPVAKLPGFSLFSAGDAYAQDLFSTALTRGGAARIRSLYTHPIVYGQVMAAALPFALHLVFARPIGGKLLGLAASACALVSIALCNARSPLLVAGIAALVYLFLFLFDLRRRLRLALGFVLLGGVLIAAPIGIAAVEQIRAGRDAGEASSSATRALQSERGRAALANSPSMGYGQGTATGYAGTIGMKNTQTIDNYYLTAAIESGYVGVGLLLVLLAVMVLQGLIAVHVTAASAPRSIACAATATIVAIAGGLSVVSITDELSIVFTMAGLLAALTGAAAAARRDRQRQVARDRRATLSGDATVPPHAAVLGGEAA